MSQPGAEGLRQPLPPPAPRSLGLHRLASVHETGNGALGDHPEAGAAGRHPPRPGQMRRSLRPHLERVPAAVAARRDPFDRAGREKTTLALGQAFFRSDLVRDGAVAETQPSSGLWPS
jgi:hypothetical protein